MGSRYFKIGEVLIIPGFIWRAFSKGGSNPVFGGILKGKFSPWGAKTLCSPILSPLIWGNSGAKHGSKVPRAFVKRVSYKGGRFGTLGVHPPLGVRLRL